jgi:hypothetical protein
MIWQVAFVTKVLALLLQEQKVQNSVELMFII